MLSKKNSFYSTHKQKTWEFKIDFGIKSLLFGGSFSSGPEKIVPDLSGGFVEYNNCIFWIWL